MDSQGNILSPSIIELLVIYEQGPDLYAFIGFIGPDDINYMC